MRNFDNFRYINTTNNSNQFLLDKRENNFNKLKENYLSILTNIYKVLLYDSLNEQKLTQVRKMNRIYRIKDLMTPSVDIKMNTLLVPFLRELFILERENSLDMQTNNDNQQYSNNQEQSINLKKLLHNRMLINYIIIKGRSRVSNIFDSLDIDNVAEFFNEFNVVENCLLTLRYFLNNLETVSNNDNESKNNNNIEDIKSFIYESLFLIHLCLHFISILQTS